MPPAEMVSALAGKSIAGFIVAEPFNAAAETAGVGKVLRLSGDVWKNHACCVTFLAERDIAERPEWAQRVTNAIVKAQLWTREQPARHRQAAVQHRRQPLHAPQPAGAGQGAGHHRLRQLRGQRRGSQQGLAAAAHRLPALSLRRPTPKSWCGRCKRPGRGRQRLPAKARSAFCRPRSGGRPLCAQGHCRGGRPAGVRPAGRSAAQGSAGASDGAESSAAALSARCAAACCWLGSPARLAGGRHPHRAPPSPRWRNRPRAARTGAGLPSCGSTSRSACSGWPWGWAWRWPGHSARGAHRPVALVLRRAPRPCSSLRG
jgi:hypothetical protein